MAEEVQTIGPFQVLARLGQGGMGVVYRCRHLESGQLVAVKTVSLTHETMLQSIRREIQALAKIRHPGIVRIWDQGVQDGLPWYAMELIEGSTLRAHVGRSRAPDPSAPRLSISETLTLVWQLCDPLAHLHGEGIVHRDLNPSNVLISSQGRPILVDFGLSSHFGGRVNRESLEAPQGLAGTVSYVAPEQILGELVDARADLYSLGCILYELLAGRAPFVDPAPRRVLLQHLEARPQPPSTFSPGLAPELDELVLRLLEKDPRLRPGHAADLAAHLCLLGARAPASHRFEARPYLYRPSFKGRAKSMKALQNCLSRLKDGHGGVVFIRGESGIGKTRLALEVARSPERQGVRVVTGECVAPSGEALGAATTGPLHAIRPILRAISDCCHERGPDEAPRLLGLHGRLLAQFEPELKGIPGIESMAEPPELPSNAGRNLVFRVLAGALQALGAERPVLLILDDLQWADELTLGWLRFVLEAHQPQNMNALILATYRTEEAGPELEGIAGHEHAVRLELERFDQASVSAMVGDMLALDPPPAELQHHLGRHSSGNPFFVAEYLRAAVDEGLLLRDARGSWCLAEPQDSTGTKAKLARMPLPGTIHELIRRRLAALPSDALRFAEAAAVVGREFAVTLVTGLLRPRDSSGARSNDAVAELMRRQILEESVPGHLRFVHDKLQEIAYSSIASRRRKQLHRAAAWLISSDSSLDTDSKLAPLGQHWECAGESDKAAECFLAAARSGTRRYSLGEKEALYRSALRCLPEVSDRCVAARSELSHDVLVFVGQPTEAFQMQRSAVEAANRLGDARLLALTTLRLASAYWRFDRIHEARSEVATAWQMFETLDEPFRRAECLNLMGLISHFECKFDLADRQFAEAVSLFKSQQHGAMEALGLANRALVLHALGRLEEALLIVEEAAAVAERNEARHPVQLLYRLSALAGTLLDLGRLDRAKEVQQRNLAASRSLGDRFQEGVILGALAVYAWIEGNLEESCRLSEQALRIQREVGLRRQEGLSLRNLALALADLGKPEEAREHLLDSMEILRTVGDKLNRACALYCLAMVERRGGSGSRRIESLLAEAGSFVEELRSPQFAVLYLCERGHLALLKGREGRSHLEDAQSICRTSNIGSTYELKMAVERLEKAVAVFEKDQPLFRGECFDELPEGWKRWSRERGKLPRRRRRSTLSAEGDVPSQQG